MDASYLLSVAVAANTLREASARIAWPACEKHATARTIFRSDCGVSPPLVPCRLDRDRQRGAAGLLLPGKQRRVHQTSGLVRRQSENGQIDAESKAYGGEGANPSAASDAHVPGDAGAVVAAVDDEIVALGLQPDGAVDRIRKQHVVVRCTQGFAQI